MKGSPPRFLCLYGAFTGSCPAEFSLSIPSCAWAFQYNNTRGTSVISVVVVIVIVIVIIIIIRYHQMSSVSFVRFVPGNAWLASWYALEPGWSFQVHGARCQEAPWCDTWSRQFNVYFLICWHDGMMWDMWDPWEANRLWIGCFKNGACPQFTLAHPEKEQIETWRIKKNAVVLFITFMHLRSVSVLLSGHGRGTWILVSGNFSVYCTHLYSLSASTGWVSNDLDVYCNTCWTGESSEDALSTSGHGWHNIVMK